MVGANSSSEGRVEVCYNGSFHSVCDDFWDALNAQVVCRQLGFSSSLGKYIFDFSAYICHYFRGCGVSVVGRRVLLAEVFSRTLHFCYHKNKNVFFYLKTNIYSGLTSVPM